MAADWFLVQFKPNAQNVANRNLQQQGFETFLPLHEVTRRHGARFVRDLRPLFPGYMFIRLDPDVAPWRKVNSTQGVSRIVQFSDALAPVPGDLMTRLLERCDESGRVRTAETIVEGQTLEVIDGPFSSFVGTVEKVDAQKRVWLLFEFMGQGMRIHLNPNQVVPRH
jgi:transcriptional antiterminator RfaH